ncbi:MAG: hypothetical protein GY861_04930 [bacterium]|nr:hypothetical protein [bacterium]
MTKSDVEKIREWVKERPPIVAIGKSVDPNTRMGFEIKVEIPDYAVNKEKLLTYLESLVGVCEWESIVIPWDEASDVKYFKTKCNNSVSQYVESNYKHCPYCGKEIEVIE